MNTDCKGFKYYAQLCVLFAVIGFGIIPVGCKGSKAKAPDKVEIPPPSPKVEKVYNGAKELAESNNWKRCVSLLKKVLPEVKNPEQKEKIQLLLAEGYFQLKRYEDANDTYDLCLKEFPKTEHLNKIIERKYQIGFKFLGGAKTSLWGLYIVPATNKGLAIIKDMLKKFPYAEPSADYQFKLAEHYCQKKMYAEARLEYESFIQAYPKHKLLPKAQFRLADAYLQEYRGPDYDQTMLEQAKIASRIYLKKYPEDEWIEQGEQKYKEIISKEAERDYLVGCYYLSVGKKQSADIYFNSLIKNYPETTWAKKAQSIMSQQGMK